MTTGFPDASMLAQVLQRIILDNQPVSLLDTYAVTRRDVFLNYTSATASANSGRLLGTDAETQKEREGFFAKINKPDIPLLIKMLENEMGIATPLP